MLIDRSYFIAEINIPNTDNADAGIGVLLDTFIAKYEPQFLRYVLGVQLYTVYKADATPQRFVDLIQGVDYTDQGLQQFTWLGLAPTTKDSPIANYVYYWFMRNNATQSTTMGEVSTSKENAVSMGPGEKMARAWNEMSQRVRQLAHFMNTKRDVYPEWNQQRLYTMLERMAPINEFNI